MQEAVLNMDESVLSPDILSAISQAAPTKAECGELASFLAVRPYLSSEHVVPFCAQLCTVQYIIPVCALPWGHIAYVSMLHQAHRTACGQGDAQPLVLQEFCTANFRA